MPRAAPPRWARAPRRRTAGPARSSPLRLLDGGLARLLPRPGVLLAHVAARVDRTPLALGAVERRERRLDRQLAAHGGGPLQQPLGRRRGRELLAAVEVDEPAVQAAANRAPEV